MSEEERKFSIRFWKCSNAEYPNKELKTMELKAILNLMKQLKSNLYSEAIP